MDTSLLVSLIIGFIVPVYVVCIWIPSITINGLIVIVCVLKKELHTPVNIITAHILFTGLLMSLIYSTANIIDFIIVMTTCNCYLTYYTWFISIVIHLSVYPLNGLLLAIVYLYILKSSKHKSLTVKMILIAVIIIWIASVIGASPSVYLLQYDVFVSCCENVCQNNTFFCDIERQTICTK